MWLNSVNIGNIWLISLHHQFELGSRILRGLYQLFRVLYQEVFVSGGFPSDMDWIPYIRLGDFMELNEAPYVFLCMKTDFLGNPQAWVMYVPLEDKLANARYRELSERQFNYGHQGRYDLAGGLQAEMDFIEVEMLKGGPPASAGNGIALGAHFVHRRPGDMFWDVRVDYDEFGPPLVINNVLLVAGHYWQSGKLHPL